MIEERSGRQPISALSRQKVHRLIQRRTMITLDAIEQDLNQAGFAQGTKERAGVVGGGVVHDYHTGDLISIQDPEDGKKKL